MLNVTVHLSSTTPFSSWAGPRAPARRSRLSSPSRSHCHRGPPVSGLGAPLFEIETHRPHAPRPSRSQPGHGRGAARRSGPGPTPPPRPDPRPFLLPLFSPPSGLRSRRAPLLLFSARATVSPRISTPVSYPVHRRACSAGSTHQDLGPSPEFWPPPPLSASRVGKPCLVEFFSNSSRPHPLISLSEL
jgi:hypothetical protein